MTGRNTYATLAEYKSYVTSRGQAVTTDATDDAMIDQLLEASSRYVDGKTSRFFYPRIETCNYSLPVYGRGINFNADLLEVISFLNGDDVSIASTNYNLIPKNESPKFGLEVKQTSSLIFQSDSNGETEYVLDLTAYFGYHNRYADAWKSVGTLGAAITDITTLAFTMTAGHTVVVGKILKIENEIYIVDTVSTNTITPLKRGDNGSTAATHLNGTAVYSWQPMEDLRVSTLETAMQAYKRRFGTSTSNSATVTGAGVVLSPRDIPTMTKDFITTYQRRV